MGNQKSNEELKEKREIQTGLVHFCIFIILIISGIVAKRVYNHPEHMMLYHGPAAVFLVIAGMKFTARIRRQYEGHRREVEAMAKKY